MQIYETVRLLLLTHCVKRLHTNVKFRHVCLPPPVLVLAPVEFERMSTHQKHFVSVRKVRFNIDAMFWLYMIVYLNILTRSLVNISKE